MPEPSPGAGALIALLIFIAASIWLGTVAHRVMQKSSFLKGYFLGNRGLGAWAMALTATVQSGGTFMGFPSLVYSHGWVVILWIASYMVVPMTAFGVLGKRLAELSRRTGAIRAICSRLWSTSIASGSTSGWARRYSRVVSWPRPETSHRAAPAKPLTGSTP